MHMWTTSCNAGNNSRSLDIEQKLNVQPISHYNYTQWWNILPANLDLSFSRCCQSITYVHSNLQNVQPKDLKGHVLWIKKNHFQHCASCMDNSKERPYLFSFSFIPTTKHRVCSSKHWTSGVQRCCNSSLTNKFMTK